MKHSFEAEIQKTVDYLNSDLAFKTIEADPYWPKWDSPWWHMALLHEMGETHRIPEKMIREFIRSLNRYPLKIFPIQAHEMPAGIDPFRGAPCHCQVGNVYQVLAKWGIQVDTEVSWLRPWILKYQMPDGGLNCDPDAYLVKDETPSSMVGTIAVFEAILLYTPRSWSATEKKFLDRAAKFLMQRRLMYGSDTKHNAAEKKSAEDWVKLCFPRYYFYDVLRGFNALITWAEKTESVIPLETIQEATLFMENTFPDGQVRIGRQCYEGTGTILQSDDGEWTRNHPATFFPLLNAVSQVGDVSPFLTEQWVSVKARLDKLTR